MSYNFTLLRSKTESEALLNTITKREEKLEFRLMGLEMKQRNTQESGEKAAITVKALKAQIKQCESIIAISKKGCLKMIS